MKLSRVLFFSAIILAFSALPALAGLPCVPFVQTQAAPEPATLALLATGLGAVALIRRVRNRK